MPSRYIYDNKRPVTIVPQTAEDHRLLHPDQLLTYKEAAYVYGYKYQSVRHYVARGSIEVVRVGNRNRITHGAMRSFIASLNATGRPVLQNAA